MPIRPRREIENAPEVQHGGFHSALAADVLDFSSNVNPFGPSPRIWEAMRRVPIGQHPDSHATPLRNLLAEIHALDPRGLIVGNGSAELIFHTAFAFVRAGDRVLIVEPTFGEYARAAALMGAEIVSFRARPEDNFEIDFDALARVVRQVKPRIVFLCNPNNPTGTLLNRDHIERLLRDFPNTLLVLDEAFIRFVQDAWDSRPWLDFDNLLILRSLTKDYALTGLRVGYAIASPFIIEALEKVQPPWSVNALAQAAAIEALRDDGYLRDSLAALARAKDDLVDAITRLGFAVLPSRVHFFLMQVDTATQFTQRLLQEKIIVRDCTSFGLPTFVRIATRKPEENTRLIRAIQELGCARER